MYRRTWITVLATLFGGCIAGTNEREEGVAKTTHLFSLRMTPVTDEEISRKKVLSLTEVFTSDNQKLMTEAVTTGSVENTTISPALNPETTLQVRYQESVYKISSTVVAEHGVGSYEYSVEINNLDENVSRSKIVSYEALPVVDRSKLADQGYDTNTTESDFGYGFQLTYTPREQNQSVLVPEPENPIIEWKSDVQGQIRIVNSSQDPRKTYRYTAKNLGSLQEVGKRLRRNYTFTLSDPSKEQRHILSEAIDSQNGYQVTAENNTTVPDGVQGLFQQFNDHVDKALNYDNKREKLTSRADYLVDYDGEIYWTELHFRSDVFDI